MYINICVCVYKYSYILCVYIHGKDLAMKNIVHFAEIGNVNMSHFGIVIS